MRPKLNEIIKWLDLNALKRGGKTEIEIVQGRQVLCILLYKIISKSFKDTEDITEDSILFHQCVQQDKESEHTINDRALVLTFRLLQLFGALPILPRKWNAKTYYVRISNVIYVLNILTTLFLCGALVWFWCFKKNLEIKVNSVKNGFSQVMQGHLLFLSNETVLLAFSVSSAFYGTARIRRILQYLENINKLKQNISNILLQHVASRKKMRCFIVIITSGLIVLGIMDTYLHKEFQGLEGCFYYILIIRMVLLEVQFVLLLEALNSAYAAINNELKEIIYQLSFNYMKKASRIKMAIHIRHLFMCLMEASTILRKININENFMLLCYIIIFPLNILMSTYFFLRKTWYNDEATIALKLLECIWILWHCTHVFLLTQPCHRTQKEIEDMKHHVAELMCYIKSEDDPLFNSVNIFYIQLILSDHSTTAMEICNIGRPLFFKIFAVVSTLIAVLKF